MNTFNEGFRLKTWLLLNRLHEQMEQSVPLTIPNGGPDPVPVEKLYFKRSEIYDRIVQKMHEMAPDGVGSQQQYLQILEQAIDTVNDELKRTMTPDEMSNIVLTLNDIERELMTPDQNLSEAISIGKAYSWKEDLMKLVQSRIKASGKSNMTENDYKDLLTQIEDEVDKTLGMIYQTLKMVPASAFFQDQ